VKLGFGVLLILFVSVNLWATEEKTERVFLVDTAKSSINWKGSKISGEHAGVIGLESADLKFLGETLVSGSFVVNMESLKNTDLEQPIDRAKLEKHLKSKDFFETELYPKSSFEFKSVKDMGNGQYSLTGDMTIKGITQEETFVTKVNLAGEKLVAVADVKIDRTKYGIMYKANSSNEDEWFFTKWFKGGKDKLINNELEIRLNIVADNQAGKIEN